MTRHRRRVIFSGIKPSGRLTLGNYPGALRHFVAVQHTGLCIFSVVDLHALTVEHDPARLRALTRQTALLEILGGCLGEGDLQAPAERYSSYSALKRDVTDAVITLLEPLQARYAELAADRAEPEPCCAGAPNGPPGSPPRPSQPPSTPSAWPHDRHRPLNGPHPRGRAFSPGARSLTGFHGSQRQVARRRPPCP